MRKDGTVWRTQKQMVELFQKDVRTMSEHIRNLFEEGELLTGTTIRKFRIVQTCCCPGKSFVNWGKGTSKNPTFRES